MNKYIVGDTINTNNYGILKVANVFQSITIKEDFVYKVQDEEGYILLLTQEEIVEDAKV